MAAKLFYHINLFKQQNNDNKFCTSQNNWQSARELKYQLKHSIYIIELN